MIDWIDKKYNVTAVYLFYFFHIPKHEMVLFGYIGLNEMYY